MTAAVKPGIVTDDRDLAAKTPLPRAEQRFPLRSRRKSERTAGAEKPADRYTAGGYPAPATAPSSRHSTGGIPAPAPARTPPTCGKRMTRSDDPNDPFNLRRFTREQQNCFTTAVAEIKKGRKSSCWMWYVIPTPPHIVNGVEMGSTTNQYYSIRAGEDEGRAYLMYENDGMSLRVNYLTIMAAIRDQLRRGTTAMALMGTLDAPKLGSSAAFFERVTRHGFDDELNFVLREVLELINIEPLPDSDTEALLAKLVKSAPPALLGRYRTSGGFRF
eukprot:gnl/TRDRNA2_/TRDRNA2_50598_c0_seq1.p1 gnl/TRDRNA2_/TRDRNA2_50598_c0~~gnl/TRDRNA2_/TRDRNA2_50598_c0_seq1.p1  ORF type:complete len:306 (-),score=40.30 gnl/TRDRNA2_/TRDRNA2_50598_c0_seq1:183-1004(-)